MRSYRDKYRLEPQPIGAGGQAEVYPAQNRATRELVALKRIRGLSVDSLSRMRREIEIQSSLKHPNVMPILDFDSDGRWYVMPRALRVLSEIGTPVPDEELRTIVEQCLVALGAAHAKGILHRDIKPANILEIADASVEFRWVLGDWGLVRRPLGETTSPHTQSGRLLGTEGFAPPESYTNAHDMTPASDIYSLGRVVAWAITGQVPAPNIELLPEGA